MITGGSKGIGLATAEAFLREGAKVAICAREPDTLAVAQAHLAKLGDVFAMVSDATDPAATEAFADAAAQRLGPIACWVNNVGASIPRAGEAYTAAEISATVAVCFHSAVYGCQSAYRHMRARGGAIVNVSSLAARCGTAGRSTLYGPMKAAVRELSVMFAAEYAACGIRVNAVLPGFTVTPAVQSTIPEAELSRRVQGILLRRSAVAREIAEPIVYLCSASASYITAASLEVSGGSGVVLNPAYAYERREKGR